MDCRQALQILEFDGGDAGDSLAEVYSAEERAAAEAHLERCPACARTVANRRDLDRAIGQAMRAVPIPRGAQQRLLARLSELESADADTDARRTAVVPAGASELDGLHSGGEEGGRNGQPSPSTAATVTPARPIQATRLASRRRFLKRLVPLSAVVVALVGFFGVVWLFTPSWSVDDISGALAKVDFESLGTLPDFTGKDAGLPSESGWERLNWKCGTQAKGLPLASNLIEVYGFDVPKTRHAGADPGAVRGLIAVIPRSRIRNLPEADSLATASPSSGYLQAQIGESVCVAWQQGDFVYVCLIRGGPDSLSTLQSLLEQPSA
jgi:hypothetical protein